MTLLVTTTRGTRYSAVMVLLTEDDPARGKMITVASGGELHRIPVKEVANITLVKRGAPCTEQQPGGQPPGCFVATAPSPPYVVTEPSFPR